MTENHETSVMSRCIAQGDSRICQDAKMNGKVMAMRL